MSPHAGEILCTQIAPKIRASIPTTVKVVGPEDHEELSQDAIATAAALLHSAEAAKKTVTPGNVAYFAIKLTRSGRRSTGSSRTDVMHPGTQMARRVRLSSLDEPMGNDEMGDALTLADVLANDQDDPSVMAARTMDWRSCLRLQSKRQRALLSLVGAGGTFREFALSAGLSDSGVQNVKRKLARDLRAFMGGEILDDIARRPMWQNNILAGRERQASRAARL